VGEDRCHPDWRIGRGSIAKHARLFFAGVVIGAALTFLVSRTDLLLPFFIVLGLVAGLPGAAVMSLPPRVLSEEARAIGMGIFSTAHYCVMLLLPPLQGSGLRNDTAATFDFAGIFLILAVPALLAFYKLAGRQSIQGASILNALNERDSRRTIDRPDL
jgi:MFS family permease